jgi:hypothetical protein
MIELSEQQIMDQIAERLTGIYPDVPSDVISRFVHEQHARTRVGQSETSFRFSSSGTREPN